MRQAGPVSRAGSVSAVCRDLGTSVKHIKNQLLDYMEITRLAGIPARRQSKMTHQKVDISLSI